MPEICPLTLLQLRVLYARRMVEDFPPDELKPLWMIERALDEGRYSCFGWFEGGEILAYALFVRLGRTALFDYYTVRRDLRDSGDGSRFIRALIERPLAGMDCVCDAFGRAGAVRRDVRPVPESAEVLPLDRQLRPGKRAPGLRGAENRDMIKFATV